MEGREEEEYSKLSGKGLISGMCTTALNEDGGGNLYDLETKVTRARGSYTSLVKGHGTFLTQTRQIQPSPYSMGSSISTRGTTGRLIRGKHA